MAVPDVTVREIREGLQPVFEKMRGKLIAAYLFGSQADGTAHARSDVDLAVLLAPEVSRDGFDPRLDLYADCSRVLKRNDIHVVLLNRTTNLFLLHDITTKGIVLYDVDREERIAFEARVLHDFIDFRDQRRRIMGV